MQLKQREISIILGKTGYGKSTWLARYCEGFNRIFAFDPFAKFPAQYLSESDLIDCDAKGVFTQEKSFRIGSFRLPDLELLGAFSFLYGDCLLVIEECGFIWSKGESIPEWLAEIVFLGRHRNVSLAVTAQRAAYIPIDLRSQAHRLVSFWQTELKDIDWLENYLGEHVEEISTLPKYVCLDAEDRNVTRYIVYPLS